jgi:serine O-acetyltransferase
VGRALACARLLDLGAAGVSRIAAWRRLVKLCRADAARWVEMEAVVDVSRVTPWVFAVLFWRYLPLRATVWFRIGGFLRDVGVKGGALLVQHRLLSRYGLDLPTLVPVEGGLYIPHPVGTIVMAERIGANVTIVGAVTLGARNGAWPTIEDGAYVGAGARVLGGITVGAGALIGANAVVLDDVPAGATAVGIPAKVVGERGVSPGSAATPAPPV